MSRGAGGAPEWEVIYDRGSVLLRGAPAGAARGLPSFLTWDGRMGAFRALATHYRALVRHLTRAGQPFADTARAYPDLPPFPPPAEPSYGYQQEALRTWSQAKRGMVELPTGAGKTRVALLAMGAVGRATLILVPTLELVTQWCAVVEREAGIAPGVVGGGSFQVEPVTVCTYASAYRHAERFGDRFGLAVFDECHHLGGAGFSHIPDLLIAPYRLGLSATLATAEGRPTVPAGLIGPIVYRKAITELSGRFLADYQVRTLHADLSAAERREYEAARETYLAFTRAQGLRPASPRGWQAFVFAACRSEEGSAALDAFYRQKRIAFAAEQKFDLCAELLHRHRGQRVLIFTNDNRTAFEVSTRFLLPLITHQTRVAERRVILGHFRSGRWPALVTSKVLNEGVDVPAAGVAIILSGNASVREHVQRLGRILRRDGDKEAVLYEVLTRGTTEEHTSRRRRQHDAYR